MTPATVLSENENDEKKNNNENESDNNQVKTTDYIKVFSDNGMKTTLCVTGNGGRIPTRTRDNISLSDIKTKKLPQIMCCEIPVTTVKCSVFESPNDHLIQKTNNGHVVERTSNGKHFYCRTHSLFTNCVINPNANEAVPFSKDRRLRTQRHPKLSLKNFTRKQIFVLLSLAIGDFISSCSMSIMAPFFPKEATEKGMGVSVSGFVFSFYALGMFIMSPIVGKILPKFGAKPLFIIGLFLSGFANLLFGFLPIIDDYTSFAIACFLIRGLEAIGAGAFSTASFVFVVEVFPDNISTVLGVLETFIGLGMSVGPAIGGILYSVGGFGLPFFVLGIFMILIVPLNFWFLPSICSRNKGDHGSFWKILKIPSVFVIGLMVVISSSIWSFLDPTLEPHLRQLNLTSKEVGLVFLLFSSIYGVFSLVWGWLADHVGNHWSMMVIGQLASVICLVTLGPSPIIKTDPNSLWETLLSLSLLGISVALTLMPTFQALLQCAVQHGHKRELTTYSIIAGAWSCMYSLGEVVGPTLGGVLLDKYGFPICSTVMAALTLMVGTGSLIFFLLQSSYEGVREEIEEKMPLIKKQEKHAYYTDLAGDSCVIFVPTARSP